MSVIKGEAEKLVGMLQRKNIKEAMQYLSRINQNKPDSVAQEAVAKALQRCLVDKKSTPIGMNSALFVYKQILILSLFDFIQTDSFNPAIHKFVYQTSQYNPTGPLKTRGQKYFMDKMGLELSEENKMMGCTIVEFSLEIIKCMADWYPVDFLANSPTIWSQYYTKLVEKGVVFPTPEQYQIMKVGEKEKFQKNHEIWVDKVLKELEELDKEGGQRQKNKITPNGEVSEDQDRNRAQDQQFLKIANSDLVSKIQRQDSGIVPRQKTNTNSLSKKPIYKQVIVEQYEEESVKPIKQQHQMTQLLKYPKQELQERKEVKKEIEQLSESSRDQKEGNPELKIDPIQKEIKKNQNEIQNNEKEIQNNNEKEVKNNEKEIKKIDKMEKIDVPSQPTFVLSNQDKNEQKYTTPIKKIYSSEQQQLTHRRLFSLRKTQNKDFYRQSPLWKDRHIYRNEKNEQGSNSVKKRSLPKTEKKCLGTHRNIGQQASLANLANLKVNIIKNHSTLQSFRKIQNQRPSATYIQDYYTHEPLLEILKKVKSKPQIIPFLPQYFKPLTNKMQQLLKQAQNIGYPSLQPSKPFLRNSTIQLRLIKLPQNSYSLSIRNMKKNSMSIGYSQALQAKHGDNFSKLIKIKGWQAKGIDEMKVWRVRPSEIVDIPFQFVTQDPNFKFLQIVIVIDQNISNVYLPITLLDQARIHKYIDLQEVDLFIGSYGKILKSTPIRISSKRWISHYQDLPQFMSKNTNPSSQIISYMNIQFLNSSSNSSNKQICRLNIFIKKYERQLYEIYSLVDYRVQDAVDYSKVLIQLLCFLFSIF